MLSILIPVYNYDVRALVRGLQAQALAAGVPFEVLCFDDGSKESFRAVNRSLRGLEGVRYEELPRNLGRSAIRNRLAEAARYPYLLFLDCDAGLVGKAFLETYLQHLHPETVLYGGRCYAPTPPSDPALFFHWHYGRRREQIPVERRRAQPHHAFMTNNFVVPRKLFLQIRFEESLTTYGHEDTLFGIELQRRRVPVLHLDNPLEHLGLEPVSIFLEKARTALRNLHRLHREGFPVQTRLLSTYRKLPRPLRRLLAHTHPALAPSLEKNFRGPRPSLLLFDLYRLGFFARLDSC